MLSTDKALPRKAMDNSVSVSGDLQGDDISECRITGSGKSHPLGSTLLCNGVNFSIFSKNCTSMELLLFDHVSDPLPAKVITLDPRHNKSYHYWHVFVPGLKAGQIYGYRAHGPYSPHQGHRFDPGKVLLDPYGKAVAIPDGYCRGAACGVGENTATSMKSVVVDARSYDWEDDIPLKRRFSRSVIYEMHVAGFTCNPNSGVTPEKRGTFAGLIEKIPYLKDLGVTAVELLPIFQFDVHDCPEDLVNYWGYSPISFFAPHAFYSSRKDPQGTIDEFRDMVKALHHNGIEVILDVVFNHTAEGDERGPTLCFRGLENSVYYLHNDTDGSYKNFSGTGNTLNANNPVVRRMIVDCLHYWVEVMHVDGFRFDLAAILSRDETGTPMDRSAHTVGYRLGPCTRRDQSSLPRPGMQSGSIRSAASLETTGRNGTANSGMMFAVFSEVIAGLSRTLQPGYWEARTFSDTKSENRSKASTSSPVMTASPSMTSSPIISSTMRPTGKTTVMAAMTT